MNDPKEYGELGMDCSITRRDFLNGVSLGITGAYALRRGMPGWAGPVRDSTALPDAAGYPPLRAGLRGNFPEAVAEFAGLEAGKYRDLAVAAGETGEEYDLVIVGAGISGLSAAHFYRTALGAGERILILDNHDDFGGHAKRNEFHYQGRTLLGFGGTYAIATPFPYSYTAKALLTELGIEVDRYPEFVNHALESKYGLRSAMFFDKEHFGEDRLVAGYGRLPWNQFLAQAPLSDTARADLVRLHGKNPDYMDGMSPQAKKAKLEKISYQEFLLQFAKVAPDAIPFFSGDAARNNKRVDTLPALEAAQHGAIGFNGLGLKLRDPFNEGSFFFHFPDGNASIARLLVSRLVPGAIAGPQSMHTIVNARVDYGQLDRADSAVRIRLSSPVVRVLHEGAPEDAEWVRVAYVERGKAKAVRARNCILACYNRLIPQLMPEMSAEQKEALEYPVKVPMLYTNVLLKKWSAMAKLGVSRVRAPGMYHTEWMLDPGTTVGGYQGVGSPEGPILVHMVRNPNRPGLPRKEQNRLGQQELLSTTFEQFELEIRRQMSRMFAAGGFDAAEDIVAITVNRWPYGYAYTYDTLADPDVAPEERPHVVGRRRFGLVSIANSDAGAAAFTNQAIDEAHRAVEEIFLRQGLT